MMGVFFSPGETFRDIARRPGFVAPLILYMVLGLGFAWMMNQRIDWGSYFRHQAEKNPRFADLSEEQKQRALGPQTKYAPMFAYGIGLAGSPLSILILSGLYLAGFNTIAGAGIRFGTTVGVVAHGLMPSAIASVLGIVTMSLKSHGDVTPETILASHVAAYLPDDTPRWLQSIGASFEIFWIWAMCLFVIGFRAGATRKVSTGTAAGIIFGIWGVWILAKAGLAAIFS
jgi:hypothetical protein